MGDEEMKDETKGTILAFLTALVSGFAIPINKLFVVNMDPTVFTAVRGLIVGLVFLFLSWQKKELDRFVFRKQKWLYLILIGILGGGMAFLMYFTGLQLTTSSRAAFLHKTLPIYTTIIAFLFLKERITGKQLIALFLMVIGTGVLYYEKIVPDIDKWPDPTFGDLLIIVATVLWAIENTIAKKVILKGESNYIVSLSRMLIGSLVLFSFIILLGKLDVLFSLNIFQALNLLISTFILFLYVFCWYAALKLINVSKASTILLISPVISLFLGILLFEEPTPLLQLIGSILILFGAYMITKVKSEFVGGI
jgi:drug/metabolite transporter (DMT)-like permease